MAQTFTSTEVVTTTNVFADNQSQRTNENTLRSNFSGATQPSDPVVGQVWYDTTNSKQMQYNGTSWVSIDTNGTTQKDVTNAKGNLTSLTDYLRVAHNDDGTLKTSPATAIDEFKDNALVITYVSTSSFTVPTDLTSIFTNNRKVKVYLESSTAISYVSSSSYDSGTNKTTVVLGGNVLDSSVTAVKYSIIQYGERQDTVHESDLSSYVTAASPAFTGTPSAPTATKFATGTQLATLDYALSAAGNQAGVVTYTASTILTAADCGKLIAVNSSSATTITLPDPNVHMVISIVNIGSGTVTIAASSGTVYDGSGSVTVTLAEYASAELFTDGTNWYRVAGTESHTLGGYTAAAIIASAGISVTSSSYSNGSGYRIYSDGYKEQWGYAGTDTASWYKVGYITFPVAFTNVPHVDPVSMPSSPVIATSGSINSYGSAVAVGVSTTGFTIGVTWTDKVNDNKYAWKACGK